MNVSKGNKTLNECIEEWQAKLESDFKLQHKCRKENTPAAQEEFKRGVKNMELRDLNIKVVNDSFLNKVYGKEVQIVKPKIIIYEGMSNKYLQILLDEVSRL